MKQRILLNIKCTGLSNACPIGASKPKSVLRAHMGEPSQRLEFRPKICSSGPKVSMGLLK
jgi:hypothetical protein